MGTSGRGLGQEEIDIKVLLCRSGRKRRCCGSPLMCGMEVVPTASAQERRAGRSLGDNGEDVGVGLERCP